METFRMLQCKLYFALRRCLNHCLVDGVWHLKIADSKFQHLLCGPCNCLDVEFCSEVWRLANMHGGSDAHPGETLLSDLLLSSAACSLPGCQDASQQLRFSDFFVVLSPILCCRPTDYITVILLGRTMFFNFGCGDLFRNCQRSICT